MTPRDQSQLPVDLQLVLETALDAVVVMNSDRIVTVTSISCAKKYRAHSDQRWVRGPANG